MAIFKLQREEKFATWWRDYYEIEADSIEEAVEIILSSKIHPYNITPIVNLQMEPTETEILDETGDIVYDSKQL